jgi:uncharacterized Zn-finger protein
MLIPISSYLHVVQVTYDGEEQAAVWSIQFQFCFVCSQVGENRTMLMDGFALERTCHQGHLKTHQHIHSGEHPYLCDVCNRSFSTKSILKIPQSTHSGQRPYLCDVCDKSFSWKSELKTHQHIHSGEHPYLCDVCSKSFSRKSYLKTHQHVHSKVSIVF